MTKKLIQQALDYCAEASRHNNDLANACMQSLSSEDFSATTLKGAAFFLERVRMYDYDIPKILKELLPEGDCPTDVDGLISEDDPIKSLGFSTKTHNALYRQRISTVGDLTSLFLSDLPSLRGVGPKAVHEIVAVLDSKGLSLRGEKVGTDVNKNTGDQWTRVSKTLPASETHVLACFDDGFIATVYYSDDWELWADSGEVLAWMPLPSPPAI